MTDRMNAKAPVSVPVPEGHPCTSRPDVVQGGAGSPLDAGVRTDMERRLGTDFSQVRVHTDAKAAESSRRLRAEAYTLGNDIVFADGRYSPHTQSGRQLLMHELTHVVQQQSVPAGPLRIGPANDSHETEAARVAMGQGVPTRAVAPAGQVQRQQRTSASADFRQFVTDAIEFLRTAAQIARVPGARRASDAQIAQQLAGFQRVVTNMKGIIDNSLGGDAALTEQLRVAYRTAVEAVIRTAAAQRTTHEHYQQHREVIHEWAWPQATTDPGASELTSQLTAGENTRIRVYTDPIPQLNLADLFGGGVARTTINPPTGTTVQLAGTIPAPLQRGLRNVAAFLLTNLTPPLPDNTTVTLALDLEPYGGDFAAFRFTHVRRGRRGAREMLVERLGSIGMEGATAAQRQDANRQFTPRGLDLRWGGGWSPQRPEEQRAVLEAVARVPATARGPLRALTFRRVAGTHPQDPRACGQYDMTAHRIDLYDCAFVSTPTRVGPPGRAAGGAGLTTGAVRVVLHEIGHVIDRVPFNQAWQTFDRAQRAGTPGARRALEQARSQSGLRWQLGRSGDFEEATGGAGAAGNEFRQAALRDGQTRVTQYSEDAWEEYYAEAFSLYVTDPETLRRLRPNVYDYFARRLPDPARPANQPAGRSGRRP